MHARSRRWILAMTTALVMAATMAGGAAAAEASAAGDSEVAGAPTQVPLQVLGYRQWKQGNTLRIVGELRNTSAYRVNATVIVRHRPGPNAPIEDLDGLAALRNLAPGARAPFSAGIILFDPPSTTILSITATGMVRPNPAAAIGLSAVSDVISNPDLVSGSPDTIRVQVRNTTDRQVLMLGMLAAFRDATGRVSNIGGSFTNDFILQPGDVWEDWVSSAGPSGVLAVRADVDVWARFEDGAKEPVVSWQNWFRDIDGSTLRMSIAWLAEQGITAGCAPFRFCPTANVTRAQMAMFLDRAFDLPSASHDYFDDDDGKTGEASINALALAGITGGCATRRFCPTANVTRAQMAMFLDRAIDPPLPSTSTDFFDDDDGKTGEASINRLAAAGITGGCGTRRYCPAAFVTRAQMAAFLKRALD